MCALPPDASAAVIGAPGSGKTTTLVELLAHRVRELGWDADEVLALTTSRTTATALRDRLAARLSLPTSGPLARSATSLAFEIATAATWNGEPLRLITGGEQDNDFAQLLEGHLDEGTGPQWPDHLGPGVRALRGFRTELRELFMRSTEFGVTPQHLRDLAAVHDHDEWRAAADFFDEYLAVVSLLRPGQVDSADLMRRAVEAIDRGGIPPALARLRLIVVDDLQEATESTFALLRAFARLGVAIVAFGDPDVAANSFRGGEPESLGRFGLTLGIPGARTLLLGTVHRQGTTLRALTTAVTGRIGAAAAGAQRAASAVTADPVDAVLRIEAPTGSRQIAAVARVLRERHLVDGVPWNEMAVIVRSGAQVPALARALAVAEVPTRMSAGGIALRDDRAARSLLGVVDVGMGRTPLSAESAADLLTGPFGGLDQLDLRRLRLALRADELATGGRRLGDELLVDALQAPGRFIMIDHRSARRAERLATLLSAVSAAASTGATVEELLWLVWDRSGLATSWRDQALGTGITAAEANRDLDGIVALFTAAKRFVEREPASPPGGFLSSVLDAEVPEDTLAPRPVGASVLVTTPSGVVGHEYEVVAVMGVQDGVWPNLRLRGSLFATQQLVDVVSGVASASIEPRKQVLGDELRMFALAVSRARRQVVISAVANEDEAPSVFFALLPDGTPSVDASTIAPLSLRGMTGRLRRELVLGRRSEADLDAIASSLAALAAEGVPGASPAQWHGLLDCSTTDPLYLDDETVPLSPSQLQAFEESPVDWFIDAIAGSTGTAAMGIGTIIHWAMETAADQSVDGLFSAVESRWAELTFESPWLAEHQKVAARTLAAGVAEYLADFGRDGKTLAGAESRFELPVGRALVRGSIDRVERAPDGSVVIVDLKTGRPVTRPADVHEHPQLRAYQLAYAEGRLDEALAPHGTHAPGGAKLLFVKEGVRGKSYREAAQPPLDHDELEGFRRRIEQAATLMAAAEFSGVVDPTAGRPPSGASRQKMHRVKAVSSD